MTPVAQIEFRLSAAFVTLLLLAGPAARAQTETSPVFVAIPGTPAPAPGAPATRPRYTSPATSAKIATTMPAYVAPRPADAPPPPDLRETDRPRNGIIRLPEYLVRENRRTLPDSFSMLTEKGRIDLALKRERGLRVVPLSGLNHRIALFMLQEAIRLRDMAAFNELIDVVAIDDPVEAKALRAEWQQTYLRNNEWIATPLTPPPLRR